MPRNVYPVFRISQIFIRHLSSETVITRWPWGKYLAHLKFNFQQLFNSIENTNTSCFVRLSVKVEIKKFNYLEK